jgi:hypothetical protein
MDKIIQLAKARKEIKHMAMPFLWHWELGGVGWVRV